MGSVDGWGSSYTWGPPWCSAFLLVAVLVAFFAWEKNIVGFGRG